MTDTSYTEHLDEKPRDPAKDLQTAGKLANYLAREGGERTDKIRFVLKQLPLLEAEMEKQGPANGRAAAAIMRSLVIRYWRFYVEKTTGRGRGDRNARYLAELPRETRARGSEPASLASVLADLPLFGAGDPPK